MSLCPMRLSKQVAFTCCFSCPCVIIFGAPSHRNFAQTPDRQETMVWLIYWVQLIIACLVYRSVAATHLLIIQKYTELCRLQFKISMQLLIFWFHFELINYSQWPSVRHLHVTETFCDKFNLLSRPDHNHAARHFSKFFPMIYKIKLCLSS